MSENFLPDLASLLIIFEREKIREKDVELGKILTPEFVNSVLKLAVENVKSVKNIEDNSEIIKSIKEELDDELKEKFNPKEFMVENIGDSSLILLDNFYRNKISRDSEYIGALNAANFIGDLKTVYTILEKFRIEKKLKTYIDEINIANEDIIGFIESKKIVEIDSCNDFFVALNRDEEIFCLDNYLSNKIPKGKFKNISCSEEDVCAIDINGKLHVWGDDWNTNDLKVDENIKFSKIHFNRDTLIAIDEEGKLHIPINPSGRKKDIPNGKFIDVACGDCHYIALDSEGKLYCWGENTNGQLDDIPDGTFVKIASGSLFSVAIDINGKIHLWGDDENTENLEGKFLDVKCGNEFCIALRDDGVIFSIGPGMIFQFSHPGVIFEKVFSKYFNWAAIDINKKLYIGNSTFKLGHQISDLNFITATCGCFECVAIDEEGELHTFNFVR